MIIDCHGHVAYHKLFSNSFLKGLINEESEDNIYQHKKFSLLKLFLQDKSCKLLLKQMNDAKIDKTFLLIVDDAEYFGKNELSISKVYKLHHSILKNNPERFVVFAGYNPNRGKKGLRFLKKGISKYGFKGVKLYPPFGFKIDDNRLDECYEYCNNRGLPIIIHIGFSMKGLENINAEPNALFKIADKYRNINFIMAHTGYKLSDPIIRDLLLIDNVFGDLSGFQSVIGTVEGMNDIKKAFREPYCKKILFGSDWPIMNLINPISKQINDLKNIVNASNEINENALNSILSFNAISALKL